MAWSHTVCFGNRCDCCSLKTLACRWNSVGIFDKSASGGEVGSWNAIRVMKYLSCVGRGTFLVLGTKMAFFAFGARIIIGSWAWSIQPRFQSIRGCAAVNHGYPKIALCSPKSERKNLMVVVFVPVLTSRSV